MNPDQVIDEASRKLQEQKQKISIPAAQGTSTPGKLKTLQQFYHLRKPKQDQTLHIRKINTGSIWTKRSFNSTLRPKPPQQPTPLLWTSTPPVKAAPQPTSTQTTPKPTPVHKPTPMPSGQTPIESVPSTARTTDPTLLPYPTTPTPNKPPVPAFQPKNDLNSPKIPPVAIQKNSEKNNTN